MELTIYFTRTNETYKGSTNLIVNGFINKCLGKNNKYHDTMSMYCVSQLRGVKMSKDGTFHFNGEEQPHVIVRSPDNDFIFNLFVGTHDFGIGKEALLGMCLDGVAVTDTIGNPMPEYDIVYTISPILLRDTRFTEKKHYCTFRDSEFTTILKDSCVRKLVAYGVEQEKAESINIELLHPENSKVKTVEIKGVKQFCSQVMLKVTGDPNTRKILYELGFGKGTGIGFGSVKALRKNKININK